VVEQKQDSPTEVSNDGGDNRLGTAHTIISTGDSTRRPALLQERQQKLCHVLPPDDDSSDSGMGVLFPNRINDSDLLSSIATTPPAIAENAATAVDISSPFCSG
jgi:hypothetical protein